MRLKTYRAPSMADALTQVKNDLGKSAVILHTRSVKVGGVLGFGARTVIEITASDEDVPTSRRGARAREAVSSAAASPAAGSAMNAYKRASVAPVQAPAIETRAAVAPQKPAAPTAAPLASLSSDAGVTFTRSSAPVERPAVATPRIATDAQVMTVRSRTAGAEVPLLDGSKSQRGTTSLIPVELSTDHSIRRELADIKLLVNQVLHASPTTSAGLAAGQMPDALFRHYLRLLEAAVSRDLADQLIGKVRDELTAGELQDDSIVRNAVLRHLAELIPVANHITGVDTNTRARAGRPTVIALVGPTGVGKTTTIAKLAASYKLRHGKTVGLITSDTYRIAAVDQLRTYAGIIGLPLKVVLTPNEMTAAVAALSSCDVILVDTAGRSQFNTDRLEELREFLDAAAPDEVHLVLSTTAAEPVLLKTAEAFSALKPNRVILTKLDEAVNFGVVVNVARRVRAQLSYITVGQEVPDHLEASRSDRLARMVLDNSLGASAAPVQHRPAAKAKAPVAEPIYAAVGGTVSA